MTIRFNIAEAKAKLSELVALAEAGEEVIIARHGKEVVRLAPVTRQQSGTRRIGVWDHLALNLPDNLFIGSDPETEAEADGPIFPEE